MGVRPPMGFKAGARKINCEEYLPEPGDWEDTLVRHEFKDGWKIVEDVTTYDRKLMAKLTMTCVGGQPYIDRCFPGISEEEWWAQKRENFIRQYDHPTFRSRFETYHDKKKRKAAIKADPYYATYFGRDGANGIYFKDFKTFEEWVEAVWQRQKVVYKLAKVPTPVYRLMHIEDPEGRPRACMLLVHISKAHKGSSVAYGTSNDLGQKDPIEIDGEPFRIAEVRLGTGDSAPKKVLPYAVAWYQHCTGTWDQEAFEKHKPQKYTAVRQHGDLERFRRKEPANAGA